MEVCRARWDPAYLISGSDSEPAAGPYSLEPRLGFGFGLGLGLGLRLGLGFGPGLR